MCELLPVNGWSNVQSSNGRFPAAPNIGRSSRRIFRSSCREHFNRSWRREMLNRIFGLETEYGLLVNQDQPDHSPTWFAHKIRDHLFHVQRRGVLDLHHRGHDEPPGNGGFLTNAGRMYLVMGHLEFASPEWGTLADLVSSDLAGDRILQTALEDLGLADTVSLI